MKSITLVALFALSFFISNAQDNCHTNITISNTVKAEGCSDYENYVPDPNEMEIYSNLTYRVNVHFFRKSDGAGIYQTNLEPILYDLFNLVNSHYSNLAPPTLQVSSQVIEVPSAKIQFDLKDVYWHDDDVYYDHDGRCGPYHFDQYGINPECEINIFYYFSDTESGGCGPYPYVNFVYGEAPNWIDGGWAHSQMIAHELGHVLGLPHTFSGCNDDAFDDTYHPDPNKDWLSCGVNAAYAQCGGGVGISDNIMGYNTCRSYLSPKQIAKIRYNSVFSSNRRKFLVDNYDVNNSIEVNSTQTWNYQKFITGDLTVNSGSILTIKCSIYFSDLSKVVIEPGAKLIIDGGRLTNSGTSKCSGSEKYWQGVQVYGTSNQHQFPAHNPTHQGMLELKNGGTIEYAHKAVTNWKEGSWNEIGGVIKSTGGIFRNNRRGVEFMAYYNTHPTSNDTIDNLSRFTDTEFLTDDDFIEGYPQQPHATLWKVQGVRFINCHFENNVTTNKSTSSSPNEGISSLDASFSILPACADITIPIGQPCPSASVLRSSFSNLEFAVQVAGAGTSDAVTVSQADFTNNVWGIYVDEFDNVNLNRNDFAIGNGGYANSVYFGNGITLDNATGFIVEENPVLNTLVNGKTSGIVVINSGVADNKVYKNTLTNLFEGTRADKINRQSDLHLNKGLQFLCNDYINNKSAISVNYGLEFNGIRYYQGEFYSNTSAGNTFLQNNTDIVNNTGSHFNYYHSGGNNQPNVVTGPVNTVSGANNNTCPTSFTYGIGVSMLDHLTTELANYETDLASHKTTYVVLKYNHISLIDNGNTDILQSQIENNWSSDAWTLRNNLMQEAPYLSKEALLTAAGENILPNAMLLEVLLANPDATKGEEFIAELNDVTNYTLPEYMLNYVRNNWNTETVRTTLEGEIMAYQSKIAEATHFIKYLKKSKDEHTYSERYSTVLMGEGISNKIGVMDFFIENSEWSRADSVLQDIQNDETLQSSLDMIEDFDSYITFRSSLGERNIAQLDSTEVQYLETLAEKGSRASGYAENILCFFYDICFEKEAPEGGGMAKMLTIPAPSGNEPTLEELMYNITVYPNPASDFTSIKWEIYDELNNSHYKIFDLNGREMGSGAIEKNEGEQVIDTRSLTNGVYIINFYNDEIMKMNSKLIVDKEN